MTKKLNEFFDEARHRALKEDFEIGQAAMALQELKKASRQFQAFLDGQFTEDFKKLHNDPRNIEDGVMPLADSLRKQRDALSAVVDEMDSYLDEVGLYMDPTSMYKGKQNENRWTRWEHRTPRHLDRDE